MIRTNHTAIRKLAALGVAALLLSSTACSAHGNASANTDTGTMRVAYLSTANYLTTLKNEQFAQDELAPATVEFRVHRPLQSGRRPHRRTVGQRRRHVDGHRLVHQPHRPGPAVGRVRHRIL